MTQHRMLANASLRVSESKVTHRVSGFYVELSTTCNGCAVHDCGHALPDARFSRDIPKYFQQLL
jgi:hypothetical protein